MGASGSTTRYTTDLRVIRATDREKFGIAPICRVLTELGAPIASRTYYAHVAGARNKRTLWEVTITELLAGFDEPARRAAGHRSRCTAASRCRKIYSGEGVPVARCTVERLARQQGWRGATRVRTLRQHDRRPGRGQGA